MHKNNAVQRAAHFSDVSSRREETPGETTQAITTQAIHCEQPYARIQLANATGK
jgi:hypothetical protein